ncbi:MAG: isopentenyl phosphate kinase family protein [Anaerolineae bacterium]|nr:isopentenyl phosphate kinase family protein [Anaerolineae bacterium]
MITLVKFGGSLITDKTVASSFRKDVVERLAQELKAAFAAQPEMKLILGNGSGSFGHVEAKKYNTINGVISTDEWRGFTKVAAVASEIGQYVSETLVAADMPVFRVQPSASVIAADGAIQSMALGPIQDGLEHGLVPLVHGDVAFDQVRGGTVVSTETVFTYLCKQLPVERILLLGTEDGVYDMEKHTIEHITSANLDTYREALGGSGGVDVTGGMFTKVMDMLALASARPGLQVRVMSGTTPGLLTQALLGESQPGTLITA